MRVAFVGKGGAGKSVLAGTFARMLARSGERVLAVDSDPMPGLAYSVGLSPTEAGIPGDAVEEVAKDGGTRFQLRTGMSATEAVERYAHPGPEGIRVLQLGKLGGGASRLARASSAAFQQVVDGLPEAAWHVVGDLPGGTRQAFYGWGRYARIAVLVTEPTAASLLSARRLSGLTRTAQTPRVSVVANKVRSDDDVDAVRAATGLPVVAAFPYDSAVVEAERRGRPLIDQSPDSRTVAELGSLVDRFRKGMTS